MGVIREFWLSIIILLLCSSGVYHAMRIFPWLRPPDSLMVFAVLGGGFLLFSLTLLIWDRLSKLFAKLLRKDKSNKPK